MRLGKVLVNRVLSLSLFLCACVSINHLVTGMYRGGSNTLASISVNKRANASNYSPCLCVCVAFRIAMAVLLRR